MIQDQNNIAASMEELRERRKKEIEKIKAMRKKRKFGIKRRLTVMGVLPAAIVTIVLTIYAYSSLTSGLYDEMLNGLYMLAESAEAGYNALEGNYILKGSELYKGNRNITADTALIDSFTENVDADVTICYGKTRFATSLLDKSGSRIVGTDIMDEVWKTVSAGQTYKTKDITINDERYVAVYIPLKENGSVIGCVFAGQPAQEVSEYINGRVEGFMIWSLVLIILAAGGTYITSMRLSKPIVLAEDCILELASGNLDVTVSKKVTGRNDEIGDMGRSVEQLSQKLREIVGDISDITQQLNDSGEALSMAATQSNTASIEISSAVEDISRGATSQAEEIESASVKIKHMGDVIGQIVDNVGTLTETAADMGKAGDESIETIEDLSVSNENTNNAILKIAEQIQHTDNEIKKINDSTALITEIAEQTNLLSLNASIESARAGEAGRGFAVVASEIQKLAVQSNSAALEIQGIIAELIQSSKEMLEQMDGAVVLLKDQKVKLDNTKTKVGDVNDGIGVSRRGTDEIKGNADVCDDARQSVVDIITNLSSISEENAASAQQTTASMQELNATMATLADEAEKLGELAGVLKKDMEFFIL